MIRQVLTALLLGAVGCPSPVPATDLPPVLSPDAGTGADVYDQACSALRVVGCPEGKNLFCADVMRRADLEALVDFGPRSLAGAHTQTDVRKCSNGRVVCALN
jgi:hypothetical protein